MKKIILMVAAVAALSISSCNETATAKVDEANLSAAADRESIEASYPVMTFDTPNYDFGTVPMGTVVEKEYTFTNTGDSDLVIVNAKSTCGCTVPTWTKKPIAPGETGSLLVKFNTSGKPDAQSKAVTITTNTESGQEIITIKGFVAGESSTPNA